MRPLAVTVTLVFFLMAASAGDETVMPTGVVTNGGASRVTSDNYAMQFSVGQPCVGLIAEEVAEVLPELVVRDSTGRPEAVDYDKVAVYLLEVVKTQQQIADLEARLARLEGLLDAATAGGEEGHQ